MGRRRPRVQASAVETVDFMPVSARVAWSYLAAVLATVGAALLVVVSNQTLAVVACAAATGGDDPVTSCKLGYAIWAGVAGFLLCLIPAVLALKLDWWLWAAMVAGLGFLVAADAVDRWWWWAIAALMPAAAALVSANWGGGATVRRGQLALLVLLDVAAAAALIWWWFRYV
nr:hypothetical protein [Propionicimonas sp.]